MPPGKTDCLTGARPQDPAEPAALAPAQVQGEVGPEFVPSKHTHSSQLFWPLKALVTVCSLVEPP